MITPSYVWKSDNVVGRLYEEKSDYGFSSRSSKSEFETIKSLTVIILK